MKRVGMLLTVALCLLGGSAVRAADKGGATPESLPAPSAVAAPAQSGCGTACCAAAACEDHGCGHISRFRDWLMYHPPETRCPCHHGLMPCTPPLYTFFLDMCSGGRCGCAGSCGHVTPGAVVKSAPAAEPAPQGSPEPLPEPAPVRPGQK